MADQLVQPSDSFEATAMAVAYALVLRGRGTGDATAKDPQALAREVRSAYLAITGTEPAAPK